MTFKWIFDIQVSEALSSSPLFVGLWRRVWLQKPIENISCVVRVRSEYIKHSPRSGEYGVLWIMTVRQTNHFLFDIALSFPLSSRFWMPLIPFLKNELVPPKTLQSSFKLKKSWKNFTTLIFFSSESWDVEFFKSGKGGLQGGPANDLFYSEWM